MTALTERRAFPFLGDTLDDLEGISQHRLSCWLHCLRDCLYASGLHDTVRALAQPLDFAVERDADGNVVTLYGGLETDYHNPSFQRGLSASWVAASPAPEAALDRVRAELERGHAVPLSPNLSEMRHSEFYRVPFVGYPHTLIVHSLGRDTAGIADRNSRKSAGFTEHRGTVPLDELRQGMAGAPLLVFDVASPAADWDTELRALLTRSVRRLGEPDGAGRGLAGIKSLPEVIEEVSRHPRHLHMRVAGPLQRQVAGDRRLLASVLTREADEGRSPYAPERDLDLARLLHESSDSFMSLARCVHLNARSWSRAALDRCRMLSSRIYDLDARVTDLLTARLTAAA